MITISTTIVNDKAVMILTIIMSTTMTVTMLWTMAIATSSPTPTIKTMAKR